MSNLSNHTAFTVKQLTADYKLFFVAHSAKTSADESSSDLKANLNGHP